MAEDVLWPLGTIYEQGVPASMHDKVTEYCSWLQKPYVQYLGCNL